MVVRTSFVFGLLRHLPCLVPLVHLIRFIHFTIGQLTELTNDEAGVGFRADPALSVACADALRQPEVDVVSAVSFLEDNPLFNCGYGSNPTMEGTIECEAGFMSSDGFRFGAIGAVSRFKNPSQVAKALATKGGYEDLIAPMVLVSSGAEKYAEKHGFSLCDPSSLLADNIVRKWEKAKASLERAEPAESSRLDTVGAISIHGDVVEACTSSGGIMLKAPGRLGHCTIFGSGMWAERRNGRSVGISVSGCGEALTRVDFCRSLADKLLNRSDGDLPSAIVNCYLERNFLQSPVMEPIAMDRRYAGGLVLLHEDDHYELIVFHNTTVFPFAYKRGSVVRKRLSQLPQSSGILVESYSC